MDTGLVYQALKDRQVDVGLVFATDGRIPAFNFVVLKDDKGYFPTYALTPVVRKEMLDKNPKLAEHAERAVGQARRRDHGASSTPRRRRQEDGRGGRRHLPEGAGADLIRRAAARASSRMSGSVTPASLSGRADADRVPGRRRRPICASTCDVIDGRARGWRRPAACFPNCR